MTEPPAPHDASPPGEETSDEVMMVRIAAGDARAFEALVRRHAGRVRALALRQTGSAADADEIAQDAFTKVWQRAGDFDPARGAFRSWLYRIVASRCLDLMRWRLGRGAPVQGRAEALADDALSPTAGPEQATLDRASLAAAAAAIRALPRRQRLALLMSAVAGLEAAEIAAALGTSRGSTEQLIARGRRTLRSRALEEGWSLGAVPDRGT